MSTLKRAKAVMVLTVLLMMVCADQAVLASPPGGAVQQQALSVVALRTAAEASQTQNARQIARSGSRRIQAHAQARGQRQQARRDSR